MELLLGCARGELVGTRLKDHFVESGRIQAGLQVGLRKGQVSDFDVTVARPDEVTIVLAYRATAHYDHAGVPRGLVMIARDSGAARPRAPASDGVFPASDGMVSAESVEMARSELVARVSHEVRSPLTHVIGYLELLRDGEPGPLTTQQRQMLDVIGRGAHRLLQMVEDLLAASSIEMGSFEPALERVDFSALVSDACRSVVPEARTRNLVLVAQVPDGLVVRGDAARLDRVVSNLLSNAVKFSLPGGCVEVRARARDDGVELTVVDTGIGIPLNEQDRLFGRFFRSTISRRREIPGAGLGLYIVKRIVDGHGGTVRVRSAPGEGTTVTVRLPVREPSDSGEGVEDHA